MQVAYPIWDTSLLTELDTELMERLFTDANLLDVWEARRCHAATGDVTGIYTYTYIYI
jgi:hypothetical protein